MDSPPVAAASRLRILTTPITMSSIFLPYLQNIEPGRALHPSTCPSSQSSSGKSTWTSEGLTIQTAELLGERLAKELHTFKSPERIWIRRQDNGWFSTWEECFSTMIKNLLQKLPSERKYVELLNKGEEVRKRVVPWLLRPLVIDPVLLHGDLWSGNTGTDRKTGQPVIFDPSSYYGHGEADLAIARIFGGIPESFFAAYHKQMPKTEPVQQYGLRGDLYELYHYLNHTVLFGGGYSGSALQKMNKLLRACP
ncbi:Fructosamine kinase-domain-containing protein [Pisolithus croceorrhizus]|nr:Fructosamine kinase-domain-containing protein [Pisolithus croceorrhizus]